MVIQTLKAHTKWPLLVLASAVLYLLIITNPNFGINGKPVFQSFTFQNQSAYKVSIGLPVRLKIPAINVNAGIQYLGITKSREMEIPSNTADVGWFKLGPRPGEIGSAVIAGHFNDKNGGVAVFTDLNKLKQGDKLYIEDDKGKVISFVVQKSHTYNPGYAEEVFSSSNGSNDSAHLNLITCDGVWDGVKKSYSKRLVVFTDAASL